MYELQVMNRETREWDVVTETEKPSRRQAVKFFRSTDDLTGLQWRVIQTA